MLLIILVLSIIVIYYSLKNNKVTNARKTLESFVINFTKHRITPVNDTYINEFLIISLATISSLIKSGYVNKAQETRKDNFAGVSEFVLNLNETTVVNFTIALTTYFFIKINKLIISLGENNVNINQLIETTEKKYINSFLLDNEDYVFVFNSIKELIENEVDVENFSKTNHWLYKQLFNNDDVVSMTYFSGLLTIGYNELVKHNRDNIKHNLLNN
jgi:hypothetical protein